MFSIFKNKMTAIQYKGMYQDVFGTPAGKMVLTDLCKRFHMLKAIRDDEFANGERNVMLFILSQVDCDLDQLRNNRQQHSLEIIND